MVFTSTSTTKDASKRASENLMESKPRSDAGVSALRDPESKDRANLNLRTPSNLEIWKWTLTSAATASCFVKDILATKESGTKDDFWWMGCIPCRTVKVVGVLVGVQIYVERIIYTVDDGTSVIDCTHRQETSSRAPSSPSSLTKPKFKSVVSKTLPPKPNMTFKPPVLPTPVAHVGTLVRIIGRIMKCYESRQILVDRIEPCLSYNEEPLHWLEVLALHRTSYSLPGPFVIPPSPTVTKIPAWGNPVDNSLSDESESQRAPISSVPLTPPSSSPVPIESPSSVSSSSYSSPIRLDSKPQSPVRLRHPSRLHNRDLTANTFRIYVKHYMDNAPLLNDCCLRCHPREHRSECHESGSGSGSESESDIHIGHSLNTLTTPTKPSSRKRSSYPRLNELDDTTPRPSKPGYGRKFDHTPRPHTGTQKAGKSRDVRVSTMRGFTLSYLRRVPELAEMAKRTVAAEAKRRMREERMKANDCDQSVSEKARHDERRRAIEREKAGPKMKRLFSLAILKLYEEGSIVLWDGPVRHVSDLSAGETSGLWKVNSSTASISLASASSSALGVSQRELDGNDDHDELSDPPINEEAYVPLTPDYLAKHVEMVIGSLMARSKPLSESQDSSSLTSLPPSYRGRPGPPPGPTKEEITRYLRIDERWARVGEWAVEDALEVLKKDGRAWCIGRGRWELCL